MTSRMLLMAMAPPTAGRWGRRPAAPPSRRGEALAMPSAALGVGARDTAAAARGSGACRPQMSAAVVGRSSRPQNSAEGEQVGGIGQDLADLAQEERSRLSVDEPVIEG